MCELLYIPEENLVYLSADINSLTSSHFVQPHTICTFWEKKERSYINCRDLET
jgi:hypothetical protein